MLRNSVVLLCTVCIALPSAAQQQAAAPAPATPTVIAPPAEQIAGAVMALPEDMRAGATVLGYTAVGKPMVTLREGKNDMICLPSEPTRKGFHSACYHKSMEPFMARGRELRLQGVKGEQVDTVRFAEVKAGKIKMPNSPSMLYQIFGGTFDPITSKVTGGNALYVTYIPFATPESTGISAKPTDKGPWIMHPGTPKAHIMYSGKM